MIQIWKRKMPTTLKKFLFYFFTFISIILLILAMALYRGYSETGIRLMHTYNQKLIDQIVRNYRNMDDTITTLLAKKFDSPDVVALMYRSEVEMFDKNVLMGKISQEISGYPMYHSALIYNNQAKEKFVFNMSDTQAEKVMSGIYRGDTTPRMMSVPMELTSASGVTELVFSYYMFDFVTPDSVCDGALAVNIQTDWIRELMQSSNMEKLNFFIIDQSGRVILDSTRANSFMSALDRPYLAEIKSGTQGDNFVCKVNDKKMVVTSKKIDKMDWTLICEQPFSVYSSVMKPVQQQTVLLTFLLWLLAFAAALVMALYVYNPLHRLTQYAHDVLGDDRTGTDDYKYLERALHVSTDRFRKLEENQRVIATIKRQNYFKILLEEGSLQDDSEEFRDCAAFVSDGSLFAVLLKTRDKADWEEIMSAWQAFAAPRFLQYEEVPINDRQLVVLIKEENSVNVLRDVLLREYLTFQQQARQKPGVTVSLFLTAYYTAEQIGRILPDLGRLMKYEIMYSEGCCITEEIIESNHDAKSSYYPVSIANQLLQALKNSRFDEAERCFDQLLGEIIKNDIDNFRLALIRLAFSIQSLYEEINWNKNVRLQRKMSNLMTEIMNLQGMDDVKTYYLTLFEMLCGREETPQPGSKRHALAQSVADYIQVTCHDPNLSLNGIAEVFRLSPNYIGMLFKEEMDMSVSSYLNLVRLNMSMELIKNTGFSIREIIERVGFINESGFYKLFKKQFGATPNEFRQNSLLAEQIERIRDEEK